MVSGTHLIARTQEPLVRSKPAVSAALEELLKVEELLREPLAMEVAESFERGVSQGREQGEASAQELHQHADREAQEQLAKLQEEHQQALRKAEKDHKSRMNDHTKRAAKELAAAVEAARAAALAEAATQPLSATHPFVGLLQETVRKLVQLLYFSHVSAKCSDQCHTRCVLESDDTITRHVITTQLFDVYRNMWVAPGELHACLKYEDQAVLQPVSDCSLLLVMNENCLLWGLMPVGFERRHASLKPTAPPAHHHHHPHTRRVNPG